MLPLAIALNSEPVKYGILALTAPMWIPFFKALWHTLNDGLREEGGLLGRPPTAEQLVELERRFGPASASLISVPKDGHRGHAGRPRKGAAGGAGGRDPAPRSGQGGTPGRAAKPGRPGFR
jgi:hypothetical protein